MLVALVVLSLAGTEPAAPPAQSSESAPILGAQAAKANEEQAVEPPPGLSPNGTFFPKAFVEDPLGERWFSGVILIQQGDQEIFSYTKGTDRGGKPFDLDTPFWLASITKTMTAATVMTLAAEGRVDLAHPIRDYIAELGPDGLELDGVTCTIAHVLSHHCGLARDQPLSLNYKGLYEKPEDRAAFFAHLKSGLEHRPGQKMVYSNSGYDLLGILVRDVTGESIAEAAQKRLFHPLGLTRIAYDPEGAGIDKERFPPLQLYLGNHRLSAETWLGLHWNAPRLAGASGQGLGSARDLARWFRATLRGELFSKDLVSEMLRPRNDDYGLGIVTTVREDGPRSHWHNGALEPHGISSFVEYFPDWDLTVVVLQNKSGMAGSSTRIGKHLYQLLAGEPYETPYPNTLMRKAMGSVFGLIFILVPILFVFFMLRRAFWAKTGPLLIPFLELGLYTLVAAWLRAQLQISNGEGVSWTPFLVMSLLLGLCCHRLLSRSEEMALLPKLRPWRQSLYALINGLGMIACTVYIVFRFPQLFGFSVLIFAIPAFMYRRQLRLLDLGTELEASGSVNQEPGDEPGAPS